MRKYLAMVVLLLIIGASAGCLGGEKAPDQTQIFPTTPQTITTSPPETEAKDKAQIEEPRTYTTEELLQKVLGITSFTYLSKSSLLMNVTLNQNGIEERNTVNLTTIESGYLDFDGKNAWINTTTLSLPDGVSTNFTRIIIGDTMYLVTQMGSTKSGGGLDDPIWEYNIVSMARKYLHTEPVERRENGGTVLVYRLREEDVRDLALLYLAMTPDARVEVLEGTLVLRFVNGTLAGGEIMYHVTLNASISEPSLGNMTITQEALWRESANIGEINRKIEVAEPST